MKNKKELTQSEYKEKVTSWLRTARQRSATHMIIAFDTTKQNPFPVYIGRDTSVQQKIKSFNDNDFVRAVEVYNMKMDIDTQVQQGRAWNV